VKSSGVFLILYAHVLYFPFMLVQRGPRGFFMSTFTVDDDLYQQASEAAAAQGKTIDAFVGEALRQALSRSGVRRTVRNGLPVMVVLDGTPLIDPAKIRQHLEEEGF
jgi:hypothetical protein